MTFFSERGCTVNLHCMTMREYNLLFNAQQNTAVHPSKKKKMTTDEQEHAEKLLNKIVIEQKNKRNYYLQHGIEENDFVRKNKQQMQLLSNEVAREIININSNQLLDKTAKAQQNKVDAEDSQRKLKYFFMHKWEIIKAKVRSYMMMILLFRKHQCLKKNVFLWNISADSRYTQLHFMSIRSFKNCKIFSQPGERKTDYCT